MSGTGERALGRGGGTDLVVVMVLGAVGVALALTSVHPTVVRALFSAPLVLLLPGYALVAALLPGRSLSVGERAAAAIGTSLAVAVLLGLILDLTPGGLRTTSWAGALGTLTLGSAGAAIVRRRARTEARRRVPMGAGLAGMAVAGALVSIALIAAANGALAHQQQAAFTQLWMVPSPGAPSGPRSIEVGLTSHQPAIRVYRVEISSGGHLLRSWSVELRPGQSWLRDVTLAGPGQLPQLHAAIYPPGQVLPYRQVDLPPRPPGSGRDGL